MSLPRHIPCEAVVQSIADGVFTVDKEWNITFFNRAAESITGISSGDALGRKCWEVFRSSLCDGRCLLKECIHSDIAASNKSVFIVRADGTRVPISISASPLRSSDGSLIGGVETFRDLTDITLLRKQMIGQFAFGDIIGKSPALTRLMSILPQIAASSATTLITGESGTGKELFARAIHTTSPRNARPFVAVNCAALPAALLESELFGYKAGAFTDAKKSKAGRFALAEGGTVFLDEVGDMAPALQAKLLRVLQEKTYEPLGSTASEKTDVRIIAATNVNLEEQVHSGTFRQDLYYRLNVARLRLPALRERPEDIPLLTAHIISKQNSLQGKSIQGVSEDVQSILMRHNFPGNVRELENILEFAFILCSEEFIQTEHLPESLSCNSGELFAAGPLTMDQIKCRAAKTALVRNNGKRMATCRELGITKDTLRRLLARCDSTGE